MQRPDRGALGVALDLFIAAGRLPNPQNGTRGDWDSLIEPCAMKSAISDSSRIVAEVQA